MASQTVENYIKAIYHLAEKDGLSVSTSALSAQLATRAASVTDMLRKLAEQDLIQYEKYYGVKLTSSGKNLATQLIRKHRLWETFLHKKLGISWDGIHDIAEQLEHIQSPLMIDALDKFLDFPKFDPHGDPIPDAQGKFTLRHQILLSSMIPDEHATIVAVKGHDTGFLQYLDQKGLHINTRIKMIEIIDFDGSVNISLENNTLVQLSGKAAENIYVKKINEHG